MRSVCAWHTATSMRTLRKAPRSPGWARSQASISRRSARKGVARMGIFGSSRWRKAGLMPSATTVVVR